jgi:hypothetical protein
MIEGITLVGSIAGLLVGAFTVWDRRIWNPHQYMQVAQF